MIFPDLSVAENIFIGHRNRGQLVRWRQDVRRGGRDPAIARHRRRSAGAGQHAGGRRPAGGGDRQGDLPRHPGADHGRADGVAVGPRGRPAVRPGQPAARPRRRRAVHQPPPRRGVPHRRPDHRVPRRPAHLDPTDRRDEPRAARSRDGRPGHRRLLRAHPPRTRRHRVAGRGARPRRHVRRCELRGPRRRGRRLRRARRRRAHRRRAGPVRHRPRRAGHDHRRRQRRCEIRSPRDAMRLGIAYLSEDRRRLGLSMPQSVASNITLPAIGSYRTPFGLLDRRAEEAVAATLPRSAEHSHGVAAHAGRQPVRRQPAEDDARQVAQRRAADPRSSTSRPAGSTSAPRPMSTS